MRQGTMADTEKEKFILFMVRSGVLSFGEFVTKSGRRTPYFINTGNYRSGAQMATLGEHYGRVIEREFGGDVDVLFGPAYKGIPLAVAAAIALERTWGRAVDVCFNRKEVKNHGEGGSLIGRKLQDGDRVVIVEDVTTAGTSIRETVPLLRAAARVELAGLVVSVDRMEQGSGGGSALAEISAEYDMPVHALVTLDDIVECLHGREVDGGVVLDDRFKERIDRYRLQYGA